MKVIDKLYISDFRIRKTVDSSGDCDFITYDILNYFKEEA